MFEIENDTVFYVYAHFLIFTFFFLLFLSFYFPFLTIKNIYQNQTNNNNTNANTNQKSPNKSKSCCVFSKPQKNINIKQIQIKTRK